MKDVFRIYGVRRIDIKRTLNEPLLIISNENSKPYGCLECISLLGSNLNVEKYFISHFQLELTKTQVMKLTNEDGFVEKADFIKCCQVINNRS